jgi:hypothetical protein
MAYSSGHLALLNDLGVLLVPPQYRINRALLTWEGR